MSAGAVMWRACEFKPQLSEAEAREQADRHNRNKRRRDQRMRAFCCGVCLHWHCGHVRHSGKKLRAGGV